MRLTVAMVLLAISLLGVPIATASAQAVTHTDSSGTTIATLSYVETSGPYLPEYRDVRLSIKRTDAVVLDTAIEPLDPGGVVWPGADEPVDVRDLDGDGEPEVLLDLYTGGANCCAYSVIYRFAATTYTSVVQRWNNPGYRLIGAPDGSRPEFLSGDSRFRYAFASGAGSRYPVRIWRYDGGALEDVTRDRRERVARHAAGLWQEYRRVRTRRDAEVTGILAAFAADAHLIGAGRDAWRRLQSAVRRGDVTAGYLRRLRRFLLRTEYATARSLPLAWTRASLRRSYDGFVAGYDGRRDASRGQGGYHSLELRVRPPVAMRYRVCLAGGVGRADRCYTRRTSRGGRSSINVSLFVNDIGGPGRWQATWYVGGRRVDRYAFRLRPEGV